MTNADIGLAEAGDFLFIEMNAMCQPGAVVQPADIFEVVNRTEAKALKTEVLFVDGFA